jgi:hypothetical protein
MKNEKFTVVSKVRGQRNRWTVQFRLTGEDQTRVVWGWSEKQCFYQIYQMVGSVQVQQNFNINSHYLPRKRSNSGRYFLNNNGVMVEE